MKLIKYDPKYKDKFIEYNKDWILDNFNVLEKDDIETFNNIDEYLKNGSEIFMAVDNDILLSGCMAKKEADDIWEICKLCSNKHVEHKGMGSLVFKACLDYCIEQNAKRIYIVTNSKLKTAIHIYKKFGFKEMKLQDYHYKRADIGFERII